MNNIPIYPLVTNIFTTYIIIYACFFSMRLFAFLHEFVCFLNTFVYFCMRVNAFACVCMRVCVRFWVCLCAFSCVFVRLTMFFHVFTCVYVHFGMCLCTFIHAFVSVITCVYVSLTDVCVFSSAYYMSYICVCMLYNTNAWAHSIPIYPLCINSYHYNSNI